MPSMEDPTPEQTDAQKKLWPHGKSGRICGPAERERKAHTGTGLLAGLVTPFATFCPSCPADEGSESMALVGTWHAHTTSLLEFLQDRNTVLKNYFIYEVCLAQLEGEKEKTKYP